MAEISESEVHAADVPLPMDGSETSSTELDTQLQARISLRSSLPTRSIMAEMSESEVHAADVPLPMDGSETSSTELDTQNSSHMASISEGESQPADTTTLTEFTSFPNLPAEIRIRIWKAAFEDLPPRFVTIRLHSLKIREVEGPKGPAPNVCGSFWSPTPIPGLARVNYESYEQFKELHKKCFAPAAHGSRVSVGLPGIINFDYTKDIALLSAVPSPRARSPMTDYLGIDDIQRIQKVAISGWNLPRGHSKSNCFEIFCNTFPLFGALKTVYLLPEEEDGLDDVPASESPSELPPSITGGFGYAAGTLQSRVEPVPGRYLRQSFRGLQIHRGLSMMTTSPKIIFHSSPGFIQRETEKYAEELKKHEAERAKKEAEVEEYRTRAINKSREAKLEAGAPGNPQFGEANLEENEGFIV